MWQKNNAGMALVSVFLAFCAQAPAMGNGEPYKLSSKSANQVSSQQPVIKLERFRGGCRACPAYEVLIHSDGGVTYVGKDFVNVFGVQRERLDMAQLKPLLAAMEALKVKNLQSSYVEFGVPDSSTVVLSIWRDGKQVSVRFQPYVGKGPVALRHLADLVDSTVGTKKWICPVPQFNEIVCPKK